MLIGGNCAADRAECGGSLGDSHMRLGGTVVDMMKGKWQRLPNELEVFMYQAGRMGQIAEFM